MIIALFFLPLVLLIITIGLPLLVFLVSVAAMFFLSYQRIVALYSDCQVVFGQRPLDQCNRLTMRVPDSYAKFAPSAGPAGSGARSRPKTTPRKSLPLAPTALWTIPESPSVASSSSSSDDSWNVDRRKTTIDLYDILVPIRQRIQDGCVAYSQQ